MSTVRRGVRRVCQEQRRQFLPDATHVDLTHYATVPVVRAKTWLATLAGVFNTHDHGAARRIADVLGGHLILVGCGATP